jgi:hypothetical protein
MRGRLLTGAGRRPDDAATPPYGVMERGFHKPVDLETRLGQLGR